MIGINQMLTRLNRQAQAWSDLAADDEFAGLGLADYRSEIAVLLASRDEMLASQTALRAAIKRRKLAEKRAMQLSKRVAQAMRSHPKHGEDSPLLRASGFKTESERRSGLTRKSKVVATTTAEA